MARLLLRCSLLLPAATSLACESKSAADEITTAAVGPDPDFAGCQAACGFNEAYDEAEVVSQPDAQIGDLTRCPVSDAVFRIREDQPMVEHLGVRYYVCCDGCAARFRQEPARFAVPRS